MTQLTEEQQPKMNAPDRIWLQPGQALDPTECTLSHAGTERVTAADVEYVRADLLDSDSQVAETFVGPCVSCGHNNYDAERKECNQRWMEGRMSVVCGCPCARHNSLANVATAMRDKCVEKVKVAREKYRADASNASQRSDGRNQYILLHMAQAATEILTELEPLTLDQVNPGEM